MTAQRQPVPPQPRHAPSRRNTSRTATAAALALALLAGACTSLTGSQGEQGEQGEPGEPGESAPRDGIGATSASDREGTAYTLPDDLVLAGALAAFDSCDGFLRHVQERALELVTPYGLGGGGWWGPGGPEIALEEDGAMAESDDAGAARSDAAGPPTSGEDFSGTNVQEAGVDEPDLLKTDGRTMFVVNRGRLEVLDVTGDQPRSLTSLPLDVGWDAQLLLHGDRLLVTSASGIVVPFAAEAAAGASPEAPASGTATADGEDVATDELAASDAIHHGGSGSTLLTSIDVSDPSRPIVDERLTLDGWIVNSRLVDGVMRLVVRTEAGINLPWEYPRAGGLRAERLALETNRELIRNSTAEDWLPYSIHETADGSEQADTLLACNRIAHPEDFAGLGVLSVLTMDLGTGSLLPGKAATGLLAAGDTVYASPETLYVATTRWQDWTTLTDQQRDRRQEEVTTELHAFDIADPRAADYLGSGVVPGTLLSQWAMSEHGGHLRVASTVGSPWDDRGRPSESIVTVLRVRDGERTDRQPDDRADDRTGELTQVGQVTGLGVTERIYAVRFMGEVGYVVTFRETDPLYTLDLRDPTTPKVTGELKIMGYSAYLHPMGDDLLLGVGQDADARGRTRGLQLSLFDVSDPAAPALRSQTGLADGSSDVEYDHRAFLHWPATGLTAVPFQRWIDWGDPAVRRDPEPASGVWVFTATRAEGIQTEGTISHLDPYLRDLGIEDLAKGGEGGDGGQDRLSPEREDLLWRSSYEMRIMRSVVIGDRLVTVSEVGVAVHDRDSLDERGWLTFG